MSFKNFKRRLEIRQGKIVEEVVEASADDALVDIDSLSKAELDSYAEKEHKISLDRRQSKRNMIKEFFTKLKAQGDE